MRLRSFRYTDTITRRSACRFSAALMARCYLRPFRVMPEAPGAASAPRRDIARFAAQDAGRSCRQLYRASVLLFAGMALMHLIISGILRPSRCGRRGWLGAALPEFSPPRRAVATGAGSPIMPSFKWLLPSTAHDALILLSPPLARSFTRPSPFPSVVRAR